jgi:hypothetical protein
VEGASCVRRPRRPTSCSKVGDTVEISRGAKDLEQRLEDILLQQGVRLQPSNVRRLAQCIEKSHRHRDWIAHRWHKQDAFPEGDILWLILGADAEGNRDEALWRAFLAAHFGRPSANSATERESAARFLGGFTSAPVWTWERVSSGSGDLRRWLLEHSTDLATLSYGNHRKYESKKPESLWRTVASFLEFVRQKGGTPAIAFAPGNDPMLDRSERFQVLFGCLHALHRFGRTGCFDLLVLLNDLKLIDAEPDGCYLAGSTGPLTGARRLWGKRPNRVLEELTRDLAQQTGLHPVVIEDALCEWQKMGDPA